MTSSADGDGGSGHNLLDKSFSVSEFEFPDTDSGNMDGVGGEQSPMAQSSPLARIFSISTEGREALRTYGMSLDLLEEQKREKDQQIAELKQKNDDLKEEKAELKQEKAELKREKEEFKEELREIKAERAKMNQRIELLQIENQALQKIHGKQEKLQSEQSLLSDCERMKKEKEKLVKRCATLEAKCKTAKNKLELELHEVRQELSKKTTELDGKILALNDARQQISNLQREVEQQKRMKREKTYDDCRQMSADVGGRRCLKSVHGTFLRAYDSAWKVDMTRGPAKAWEHWYVEDWKGKVVFKAIHSPGRFLRAHPDGRVDLVDRPQAWETWKPFKNNDGSWSFLSVHRRWLSARQDGSVKTVSNCDGWEHFWLDFW